MHEYGRLPATSVAVAEAASDAPPAPWTLPGVTLQQVTFEVDWSAALEALPDVFSRPVPPYARLWVMDVPESAVGAYREAMLLLSCRYMMTPRHWLVASVVSSEAARDANARNWGYASEVGEVALERSGDGFVGRIEVPGGPSITVDSSAAMQTAPAIIRYDPMVGLRPSSNGSEAAQVVSLGPSLGDVEDAWLARGTEVSYEGGPRTSPWLRLRSRNPITCTIGLHEMTRPEPSAVQRPAGGGGGLP